MSALCVAVALAALTTTAQVRAEVLSADELTPYFQDGVGRAAKVAHARGKHAKVRALLADATEPPHRYLRALSAFLSGQHRAAAQEMSQLAPEYPALADRCLFFAARSYTRLGHTAEAIDHLRRIPDSSSWAPRAKVELARLLAKRGNLDESVAALRPALLSDDGGWSRDEKARGWRELAALGRTHKVPRVEREAVLALWTDYPLHGSPKPPAASLTDAHRVARARALLELGKSKPALDLVEPLRKKHKLPDAVGCQAALLSGEALRAQRKHERTIERLKSVAELCHDPQVRAQALYTLASSQAAFSWEDSIATFDALASQLPSHPLAEAALFEAADAEERLDKGREAELRLEQLLTRSPQSPLAAEAIFKLFWLKQERGDLVSALQVLRRTGELPDARVTTEQRLRAAYWTSRVTHSLGRDARPVLSALAASYPTHYYGWLASRLLGVDVARLDPVENAAHSVDWAAARAHPRFQTAVELLRLELPGATDELLAIDRSVLNHDGLWAFAEAAHQAGHAGVARVLARIAAPHARVRSLPESELALWRHVFPQAFRPHIERYSKKTGLDADLVQALMRTESNFRPTVRSPVGAVGLMQIMPGTMRQLGGSPRALTRPEVNIRYGTRYLQQLLERFDGDESRAVASYNAGPARVRRWSREVPLEKWVEEIPIDETRAYVKRVLGSRHAYRLLYAEETEATTVTVQTPR